MADTDVVLLEAKSITDGAWYDCDVTTVERSGTIPRLRVHFSEFTASEDEFLDNVEEAISSLRSRSRPMEASDCNEIKVGQVLLALQKRSSERKYFDASVVKVKRAGTCSKSQCKCAFDVKWIGSDEEGKKATLKFTSLCVLTEKDPKENPSFAKWLNSREYNAVSYVSKPSHVTKSKFESIFNNNFQATSNSSLKSNQKPFSRSNLRPDQVKSNLKPTSRSNLKSDSRPESNPKSNHEPIDKLDFRTTLEPDFESKFKPNFNFFNSNNILEPETEPNQNKLDAEVKKIVKLLYPNEIKFLEESLKKDYWISDVSFQVKQVISSKIAALLGSLRGIIDVIGPGDIAHEAVVFGPEMGNNTKRLEKDKNGDTEKDEENQNTVKNETMETENDKKRQKRQTDVTLKAETAGIWETEKDEKSPKSDGGDKNREADGGTNEKREEHGNEEAEKDKNRETEEEKYKIFSANESFHCDICGTIPKGELEISVDKTNFSSDDTPRFCLNCFVGSRKSFVSTTSFSLCHLLPNDIVNALNQVLKLEKLPRKGKSQLFQDVSSNQNTDLSLLLAKTSPISASKKNPKNDDVTSSYMRFFSGNNESKIGDHGKLRDFDKVEKGKVGGHMSTGDAKNVKEMMGRQIATDQGNEEKGQNNLLRSDLKEENVVDKVTEDLLLSDKRKSQETCDMSDMSDAHRAKVINAEKEGAESCQKKTKVV